MPKNDSKTATDSIKENRQYHTRYLMAINNPTRREILKTLKKGPATIEQLESNSKISIDILKWHLSVLEHGYCVEQEIKQGKTFYKLTKEGSVIDYLE